MVLRIMLGLYLVLLGAVGGIAAERLRFDHQRGAVLSQYQHAIRLRQSEVMSVEMQARSGAAGSPFGPDGSAGLAQR
jgi:hypothetical protein